MVYALADRGARLLIESGFECASPPTGRNNESAGRLYIEHKLEIVEFSVAVELAARHRGIRVIHASELVRAFPERGRAARNPIALHATLSTEGRSQEIEILPDLVFGLGFPDGSRRCFLVEIDRGTMPIARSNMFQTSFERKMRGYLAAYAAGQHETQFGWKAFRVLTVTTDHYRLGSMVKALRSLTVPQSPGPALFWFAAREQLRRSDPLGDTWQDGTGRKQMLL
jgi:hypothetical protein